MAAPYVPDVFKPGGSNTNHNGNAPTTPSPAPHQGGGAGAGGVFVPTSFSQQQQPHQPQQQQDNQLGEGEPLVLLVDTPPGKRVGDVVEVQVPGENRTIQAQVPPGGQVQFHLPYYPDEDAIIQSRALMDDWSNTQKIAAGVAVAVVVVGAGGYAYYKYKQSQQQQQQQHSEHPSYQRIPISHYENADSNSARIPTAQPIMTTSSQNNNQVGATEADLKNEFSKLDVNNSGYIDRSDLKKKLGMFVPATVLNAVFSYVDKNRDGRIDFQEFKAIRAKLGNQKLPGF